MEEREPRTYYPGDTIRLRLELEHEPNFRHMRAVFLGRPEGDQEGALPHRAELTAQEAAKRKADAGGTKTSVVLFESNAERRTFLPGHVYELTELSGETYGETDLSIDTGEFRGLRFRCAHEPARPYVAIKEASFLQPLEEWY